VKVAVAFLMHSPSFTTKGSVTLKPGMSIVQARP
jgi:hypothetical protein